MWKFIASLVACSTDVKLGFSPSMFRIDVHQGWLELHSLPKPLFAAWDFSSIQVGCWTNCGCGQDCFLPAMANCDPSLVRRILLQLLMPWSHPCLIIALCSMRGFPWRLLGSCILSRMPPLECWHRFAQVTLVSSFLAPKVQAEYGDWKDHLVLRNLAQTLSSRGVGHLRVPPLLEAQLVEMRARERLPCNCFPSLERPLSLEICVTPSSMVFRQILKVELLKWMFSGWLSLI